MAKILVISDLGDDAGHLATILRARNHQVTIAVKQGRLILRGLKDIVNEFQLLVVDVSRAELADVSFLQEFHMHHKSLSPSPGILCFSTCWHDARFELELERLGARYVRMR